MNQNNELDLIWIINVLWRRKWLIIGLMLLSLLVSAVVANQLPPTYEATTTIMIEQSEDGSLNEYSMLMANERLALTYSQIITSQPILKQVIANLKLDISTDELEENVTVQPIPDTQLVNITVENTSPYQVFMIANAIAETFIGYIDSLTAQNYTQALNDVELSIYQKQGEIDTILPEIDHQNQVKADLEAEVTRLEALLVDNRTNYQNLQQNAGGLELTIAQLNNKIRIVEPAHIDNTEISSAYEASLMLFFDQDIISGSANYPGRISDLIIQVYGPMLDRESLLNEVINQLDLATTPASLASHIAYTAIPNTQFLVLSVSNANADLSNQILETLTGIFITQNLSSLSKPYMERLAVIENELTELTAQMEQIQSVLNKNNSSILPIDLALDRLERDLSTKYSDLRELQASRDQYIIEARRSADTIVVAEPATQPSSQSENRVLYVALAVFVGFLASIAYAFVLEHFDSKVRTKDDLALLLGQKPIGVIGKIEKGKEKLIFNSDSSPQVIEDFRKLSAVVRQAIEGVPVRKLLITSPGPGEGKTTVAANLAITLAKTGTQVVLVDADLHCPQLDLLFNLEAQQGLAEILTSNRKRLPLQTTELQKLKVLTSGEPNPDASEWLSSPKLGTILEALTAEADLVILDCPPILALADASFVTPLVDGAILVIKAGSTDRKAAVEAIAMLKMAKIQFIGVVLNGVAAYSKAYYRYYDKGYRKAIGQAKAP